MAGVDGGEGDEVGWEVSVAREGLEKKRKEKRAFKHLSYCLKISDVLGLIEPQIQLTAYNFALRVIYFVSLPTLPRTKF